MTSPAPLLAFLGYVFCLFALSYTMPQGRLYEGILPTLQLSGVQYSILSLIFSAGTAALFFLFLEAADTSERGGLDTLLVMGVTAIYLVQGLLTIAAIMVGAMYWFGILFGLRDLGASLMAACFIVLAAPVPVKMLVAD